MTNQTEPAGRRLTAVPTGPSRPARSAVGRSAPARDQLLWLQRNVGNRAMLQRTPAVAGPVSPIPEVELLRNPAIDRIRAALAVLPDKPVSLPELNGSSPASGSAGHSPDESTGQPTQVPAGRVGSTAGQNSPHQQLMDAINAAIAPFVGPLPPALGLLVSHGVRQLIRKGSSYVLDSALSGMDDESHAAVRNAVQAALRINVWTF